LYVSRYLQQFAVRLFTELHGVPLRWAMAVSKGEVKDAIVAKPPYVNERILALITEYNEEPGRFYRETPCRAMLFYRGDGPDHGDRFIGSWRIKRIRRLAEKAARRIIDWIFAAIKGQAERLADERAARLAIPRHDLLSTPEEMHAEFVDAETRFISIFEKHGELEETPKIVINDVAGLKVVLEDHEKEKLIHALGRIGYCRLLEEEMHRGRYNAVNLIVAIRPPKDELVRDPLPPEILPVLMKRGFTAEEARREFAAFVTAGEEEVYLEIIVSNYEELLESEIGRCMHEDRIIAQRLRQQYRGHLAKNVEYLMRYLFLFPLSEQKKLTELPVKLWNRYLPDYFDGVIAGLFHIPPGDF
ncbi:MAG: hypothetical protein N2Z74_08045, partial [Syntrophales bacterium]|nr:hypothetical protein [Syntrophales bacterium]